MHKGNRGLGTRYLDPKYSRWLSTDPALGEYIPGAGKGNSKDAGSLPGMGGVFNSVNLNLYHYASNNPIKYTDPDGRIVINAAAAIGGTAAGALAGITLGASVAVQSAVVSGFASSIVTGGLLKTPALANQPCRNVVANVVGANVGGEISTGLKNSRNGEPIIQKDQQATNYLYSTAGGIVTSAFSNPTINSIGKGVLQGFKENMGAAATQEYLKEKIGNE